jgi:hypothetical protein
MASAVKKRCCRQGRTRASVSTSRGSAPEEFSTDTGTKVLIGLLRESPLAVPVSANAMRVMLGLSAVLGGTVLAAPVGRVQDLSGLALKTNENNYTAAHRILLLVKGTRTSQLDAIGETGQSLTAQSFRVSSTKAQCLLSDTEELVNLYGNCVLKTMLQYKLDKDTALVLASAVEIEPKTQENTFIVEHMEKAQDWQSLKVSLEHEGRTVLVNKTKDENEQRASPQKPEYWDRDVKRLKRMVSEP